MHPGTGAERMFPNETDVLAQSILNDTAMRTGELLSAA